LNPTLLLALLLPWGIVALVCWLGFQLMQQNGRFLLRLESLEQVLSSLRVDLAGYGPAPAAPVVVPEREGLPLGCAAPEFELPGLSGGGKALSHFRGQRLLLVFFNPRCGYCLQMAPGIAALPRDTLLPLVVTTGDAEENRQLAREHRLNCPVLLQEGMETASRYGVDGTPMGYLIDDEGRIASRIAVGGDALLALAGPAPAAAEQNAEEPDYKGNRPLSESHIERNGLPKGTPAPSFRLPRVDGGEIALEDFRGQPVLLVFSDPHCGPCDAVAPDLEQLAQRRRDVQVLMVSRGDLEENRAKALEHGLSFPVLLQRSWEVSRLYGMFGTPIGYLIDADGMIAAEAAVGGPPILDLLKAREAGLNGKHHEAKGSLAAR